MAFFNTKRAWMFDEKGEYHGSKRFSKNDTTFKYGKGSYNIDFQNSTYKEDAPLVLGIWKRRTYFYNISNSNPIHLTKKGEPNLSPELYNINLETKVARDLNDLAKDGLSKYLTPKNILIGIAIIFIIYYLSSGKKLF